LFDGGQAVEAEEALLPSSSCRLSVRADLLTAEGVGWAAALHYSCCTSSPWYCIQQKWEASEVNIPGCEVTGELFCCLLG